MTVTAGQEALAISAAAGIRDALMKTGKVNPMAGYGAGKDLSTVANMKPASPAPAATVQVSQTSAQKAPVAKSWMNQIRPT